MSEVQSEAGGPERVGAASKLGPLIEILAVFAVGAVILAMGLPWAGDNPLKFQGLAWVANVSMLCAVWVSLRRRDQNWGHIGLRFGGFGGRQLWRALWRSLVVFAAALGAFMIGAIVMVNIVGRPEQADMSGYNFLSGNLPMLVLVLAGVLVASSVGEEILYRGFLITRLEELGGGSSNALRAAVAVSSIIFGLIHFAWGPMGVVQTTFMGLALAIAFLKVQRNLWVLVLAHFYMDAILMVQMYLAPG